MDRTRRKPREAFSAISHFVGAGLFVIGLLILLALSWGRPAHLWSFGIYGAFAILLYVASGVYHSVWTKSHVFQRLDYIAIFLMIAGTYTPVCVLAIPKPTGWWVLAAEWLLAAVGVGMYIFGNGGPHWLRVMLYLVMGWLAVSVFSTLQASMPGPSLGWLVAGGLVYSIGTIFYATERPRLWPGKFGAHDLWHVFVLAASLCHYITMLYLTKIP